jgi:hypothetical protein
MSNRIRWTSEDEGIAGRAGTLDEPPFFISRPESPGKAYILTSSLASWSKDIYPNDSLSDLKVKAEQMLAGHVASLGAVFPDEPYADPDCEECGFGLPRHDKDCSHYRTGPAKEAGQ